MYNKYTDILRPRPILSNLLDKISANSYGIRLEGNMDDEELKIAGHDKAELEAEIKASEDYNSSGITVLKGLEAVRLRP